MGRKFWFDRCVRPSKSGQSEGPWLGFGYERWRAEGLLKPIEQIAISEQGGPGRVTMLESLLEQVEV